MALMRTHAWQGRGRKLTAFALMATVWLAGQLAWAQAASSPDTPVASQASAESRQANDGSDYIAAWTVMSELCEQKYPQMKPTIESFWISRWNKATRERVDAMKKGADFQTKLARYRQSLGERKDEILAQCDRLFTGGAH